MALNEKLRERIKALAGSCGTRCTVQRAIRPGGPSSSTSRTRRRRSAMPLPASCFRRACRSRPRPAGHHDGKCGGCGEPIPLREIAGRLLQAKRGEAVWQESYGQCKRCRKAFFPSVPSVGHRAG